MMDKISKTNWRQDKHLIQLTDFLASETTIGQPGTDTDPAFI